MMNNQTIKRASILRILTNSTSNVISIVFLAFLLGQLFLVNLPYLYLVIIVVALIIGDILLIIVVTTIEYRYSFLVIEEGKISYHQPLHKKKNFEYPLAEIKGLRIVAKSLLIEFANQKVLLDYLSNPLEIKKMIEEKESFIH